MLRQDDEPEDDEDEDSCGEPADNRDSMELENEAWLIDTLEGGVLFAIFHCGNIVGRQMLVVSDHVSHPV